MVTLFKKRMLYVLGKKSATQKPLGG